MKRYTCRAVKQESIHPERFFVQKDNIINVKSVLLIQKFNEHVLSNFPKFQHVLVI